MERRTKTYIAGDWTGDKDLIDQLYLWNSSKHWSLHFIDAHELTQARDTSLACSIKRSLVERLNVSKTFVLIVGKETNSLTKGGCQYCKGYNSWTQRCAHGNWIDYRSFIQFECEKAVRDNMKIVVIYNFANVRKELCPSVLQSKGTHINAYFKSLDGNYYWDYQGINNAIAGD